MKAKFYLIGLAVMAAVLVGCKKSDTENIDTKLLSGWWEQTNRTKTEYDTGNNVSNENHYFWYFSPDSIYIYDTSRELAHNTTHYVVQKESYGTIIYQDVAPKEIYYLPLKIVRLTSKELILTTNTGVRHAEPMYYTYTLVRMRIPED